MMRKHDLVARQDVSAALGLLTRLPVSVDTARAVARGAKAAWAWPLAGIIVALIAGITGMVGLGLGLPGAVVAGLVIGTQVIVTGAMHEDGLADSADGLWGGWERNARLAIMKDSRTGAYGVIALILSLGLRWQALAVLINSGWLWVPLIVAGVLSRVPMVALMCWLPAARAKGLSQSVGRPDGRALGLAALIGLVVALMFAGPVAVPLVVVCAVVTVVWAGVARAKIGGQTGDILGAAQQLTEVAVLAVLLAALV
jgi:adenosylcobinamide-GDP ribazoletransferase